MNREEQISSAFWNSVIRPNDAIYRASFEAGAKWADAHPKEKGIEMWVARDMSGDINLWDEEPIRTGNLYFQNDKSFHFPLGTEDFPEVTFKNSPMKVRLTLVKE